MKPAKKGAHKSAKNTTATGRKSKGFTDEERVAMRERVQELKADARCGRRADKGDGESAVLAKLAALPQPDRAMGERIHAIVKAHAPALSPKTWYGMPAYARQAVAAGSSCLVKGVRLQVLGVSLVTQTVATADLAEARPDCSVEGSMSFREERSSPFAQRSISEMTRSSWWAAS